MENEATVFGAQKLPWRGDDDVSSSRALLFLSSSSSSSFRRLFLCCSVPLCASSFPPLLLERRARKREKHAREEINARKFRTQKRRDVCVFSVVGRDDFFLLLLLLRCVSFKRTKDQPTNTKEEALKVFLYIYIYIYNARKWIALLCIVRACVVIFFFVKEGWWSDGTTRKSDVFVLSAPKKKERSKGESFVSFC